MMLVRRDVTCCLLMIWAGGPTYHFHDACLISDGDEEDGLFR
jgi:hypothetical protein